MILFCNSYKGGVNQGDGAGNITSAMRELFSVLDHSVSPIPPVMFLQVLRQVYPQFAQKGEGGHYMQQVSFAKHRI